MGETIEFASNGSTASGYLASGGGPGVLVLQEWWGLVPQLKGVIYFPQKFMPQTQWASGQ